MRKRDWAAMYVASFWRIRQRLPRVTAYAVEKGYLSANDVLHKVERQIPIH